MTKSKTKTLRLPPSVAAAKKYVDGGRDRGTLASIAAEFGVSAQAVSQAATRRHGQNRKSLQIAKAAKKYLAGGRGGRGGGRGGLAQGSLASIAAQFGLSKQAVWVAAKRMQLNQKG